MTTSIDPQVARRMLLVHAHPDDESINNGATMAKYVAEGVQVTLVTCTRGEQGEVIPDRLSHLAQPDASPDGLGDHRVGELAAAMAALGVTDHRFLGDPVSPGRRAGEVSADGGTVYRDSGMAYDPDGVVVPTPTQPAGAFAPAGAGSSASSGSSVSAAVEGPAEQLAALIRELRPHVVVTYEPGGGYGHPDHVQAHAVTMRAVELAGLDGVAESQEPAESPGPLAASGSAGLAGRAELSGSWESSRLAESPGRAELSGSWESSRLAESPGRAELSGSSESSESPSLPEPSRLAGSSGSSESSGRAESSGSPGSWGLAGSSLPEWVVPKVYWAVMPESLMRATLGAIAAAEGGAYQGPDPTGRMPSEVVPDDQVTAAIDAIGFTHAKVEALRAHETQISVSADGAFYALSNGIRRPVLGLEFYRLARGTPSGQRDDVGRETDLFAGT